MRLAKCADPLSEYLAKKGDRRFEHSPEPARGGSRLEGCARRHIPSESKQNIHPY